MKKDPEESLKVALELSWFVYPEQICRGKAQNCICFPVGKIHFPCFVCQSEVSRFEACKQTPIRVLSVCPKSPRFEALAFMILEFAFYLNRFVVRHERVMLLRLMQENP